MRICLENNTVLAEIDVVGAELKRLTIQGKDYLWNSDPKFWEQSSPILFPIVCDARNDEVVIRGKRYPMERHGFVQHKEFTVQQQREDRVVLTIRDDETTRANYPYWFELIVTYQLLENGIQIRTTVKNLDQEAMYYQLGFHPGFFCPWNPGETVEDYDLVFEKKETIDTPLLNGATRLVESDTVNYSMKDACRIRLNRELFQKDALIFDQISSRKISLENRMTKEHLCVAFPDFEMLGIWSPYPAEAPFVCIEPWNGTGTNAADDDEMTSRRGVQILQPGQKKEYEWGICV
ncbi:MAG: aldose 1-epimerase family protein [Hespellia sp.]|nr:aldose 1-epimerase family protein [Hespellia sp.]